MPLTAMRDAQTSPSVGQGARDPAGAPSGQPGLIMDLETMFQRLERELRRGPTLDAYLLCAGITQIIDDYVRASAYTFSAAAGYLTSCDGALARVGATAAGSVVAGARLLKTRRRSTALVLRWRRRLDELLDVLAGAQLSPGAGKNAHLGAVPGAEVLAGLHRLPTDLRRAVVRLPACFHQFDQRPRDVQSLAARLAERPEPAERALLVVGVRTSGSYLAPLCAASLRAMGYRRVRMLTIRPGHPLLGHERRLVRSIAGDGGLALLMDDPPVTGSSLAAAAAQLERVGLPSAAITLLLQVFGAGHLPDALRRYDAIVLPENEWSVEVDLEPAAVRDVLSTLLGGERAVLKAHPVPVPRPQPERSHARRRFRIEALDAAGAPADIDVVVEGVGLGYLGAYRLGAPTLVERFGATVFGLRDGLLYREWLPDDQRIAPRTSDDEDAVAAAIARYAVERRAALPVPDDLGLRMRGEQPAWEVAGGLLSQAFGRAGPVAQALVVGRAMRRVLRVQRPSTVDSNTDLGQWFLRNGSLSELIKPDVGEDRFSNLCARSFDPAFDLAGVTARAGTPTLSDKLRRSFAELGGGAVDEERWLLHELVHLWGRQRTQSDQSAELARARARALQRYFADVYLRNLRRSDDGPLCALDIDGVLEIDSFGFSGLTPAAALTLRSLLVHGYRPVLATGRSVGEVSERCRVFGLAGGVAEYGAVTFVRATGQVEPLISDGARRDLERLGAALRDIDGVRIDPDYRFSVRAFTSDGRRRRPVSDQIVAQALARAGDPAIQTVVGDDQTDFVPASVSKAAGLRALAVALRVRSTPPVVLAVGDTASDLTFAEVAGRLCAPRHADPVLARAGFEVMRRPYQAGLAQAVGGLLGHAPGGCPLCRRPATNRERAIVSALLGARERGRIGMAVRALELCWLSR